MNFVETKYLFIPTSEVTEQMRECSMGDRVSPDGLTTMLKYDGDEPTCFVGMEKLDQSAMLLIVGEWDRIEFEKINTL